MPGPMPPAAPARRAPARPEQRGTLAAASAAPENPGTPRPAGSRACVAFRTDVDAQQRTNGRKQSPQNTTTRRAATGATSQRAARGLGPPPDQTAADLQAAATMRHARCEPSHSSSATKGTHRQHRRAGGSRGTTCNTTRPAGRQHARMHGPRRAPAPGDAHGPARPAAAPTRGQLTQGHRCARARRSGARAARRARPRNAPKRPRPAGAPAETPPTTPRSRTRRPSCPPTT
jgi:hypothetical protein